jgi:hypothetical protein
MAISNHPAARLLAQVVEGFWGRDHHAMNWFLAADPEFFWWAGVPQFLLTCCWVLQWQAAVQFSRS